MDGKAKTCSAIQAINPSRQNLSRLSKVESFSCKLRLATSDLLQLKYRIFTIVIPSTTKFRLPENLSFKFIFTCQSQIDTERNHPLFCGSVTKFGSNADRKWICFHKPRFLSCCFYCKVQVHPLFFSAIDCLIITEEFS